MSRSTNKMPRVDSKISGMLQPRSLEPLVAVGLVAMALLAPSSVHGLPTVDDDVGSNGTQHKLLCLMIDGFRWNYVHQQPDELPGFERFLAEGVRANWSNPYFPTLSYPMWTTMGTGLYPEVHNIAGNYFHDDKEKDYFSIDNLSSIRKKKWWTSEPIWVTSTRAGIDTGAFQLAQCSVPWEGITPRHCEPHELKENPETFRGNLKKALDLLEHDYGFVMVYSAHVDDVGHASGPDSKKLKDTVRSLDDDVEFLLNQLDGRGLTNETNVIIVSDHGMTNFQLDKITTYNIDDYLDISLVEHISDRGPFMNIKVPPENVDKVFKQLSAIPKGVKVYRRDDIPERFRFRGSKYAHEILVVAQKGYYLSPSKNTLKQLPLKPHTHAHGIHGYDPDEMDMKGIFFARGPDFVEDAVIPPIGMVDVYQLICHILDVEPRPNNGTWMHVRAALVGEDDITAGTCPGTGSSTLAILLGLLLIIAVKRSIEG
ncbi:glycerophosphocholine cholinephosphodiesterase ENPP6-like [Oratosquilla oratoria]|uniref:glycerophosphocholine cholinephosphodiesterase ENPP6-like n=1 Tax=Oratosquilla oratoria TaxID=337810 RepID=UPI003F775FAB